MEGDSPYFDLPDRSYLTVVFESEVVIVLTIFALAGNTLTVAAFYKNKTLQTASNLLVVNLSIAGILAAVTTYPLLAAVLVIGAWRMGTALCVCQALLCSFLFTTTHLTTTLISLNRYLVVVRYKKYSNISKKPFTRKFQLVVCIFSALLALCNLITQEKIAFQPKEAVCTTPKQATITVITVLIQDLAFVATLLFNMATFKFVREHHRKVGSRLQKGNFVIKQVRRVTPSLNNRGWVNAQAKDELYIPRKVLIVTAAYSLCWLPQGLLNSVHLLAYDNFSRKFCMLSTFSMQMTSVLNPVLYALLNRKFRRAILTILGAKKHNLVYTNEANKTVTLNQTFTRLDSTALTSVATGNVNHLKGLHHVKSHNGS